jgi:hypothetical protein
VVLNPPLRHHFDDPVSKATWTWDCFAAEALPIFWSQDPSNAQLRLLVARLVFAPHYMAVEILFRRCAEQRTALGPDFGRLRHLLFEWANVRDRIAFVHRAQGAAEAISEEQAGRFSENVDQWAADRVAAFVEGRSSSTCEAWGDMDAPGRFQEIDEARKHWHYYSLDLRLVGAAHAWLPTPDHALDADERLNWLRFWREALGFIIRRAQNSRQSGSHNHPYEDEQWVLDGVAAAVQYMDAEERPEEMWLPILDLPRQAHRWPEDFLQAFHLHGLHCDPTPPAYAPTVRRMVEYILDRDADRNAESGWPYYEEIWEAVLGIDGFTRPYWEARHRALVENMRDLFERWATRTPTYGRHLASFARWLEGPAAEPIRLPGLLWLNRSLNGDEVQGGFNLESTKDAVASLLNVVWQHDQERLRRETGSFAAFHSLLRRLANQQNEVALELLGRIGGLL